MSGCTAVTVPDLAALAHRAARAVCFAELRALCAWACMRLGGSAASFGLRQGDSFVRPRLDFVSTFPEGLLAEYRRQRYVRIDAALLHAYRSSLPISWSAAWARYGSRAEQQRVMGLMRRYGYHEGLVVPVHGSGGQLSVLYLGGGDAPLFRRRLRERLPEAVYLAVLLHEAALRVSGGAGQRPALSARERECLAWAAEGKTAWETGQILGIAERTVVFHLHNACLKLGVHNRQQAVARAIALGLMASAIGELPEQRSA